MTERRVSVLVAEDDRDQREILDEVLTDEGYDVRTAASPRQTAERLVEPLDVLLLDLHGAYGDDVTRALDALGRLRPAVIVVSGDPHIHDIAAELHADGALQKPYDVEELLLTIERASRRKPQLRVVEGGLSDSALSA